MKKIFLIFLVIPLIIVAAEKKMVEGIDENSCTYNLSACAIFQNEAAYLREWIEYHRIVGVEHFFLYNNNSCDDYQSVLNPYVEQGVVELFDWPSPPDIDWTPFQERAYNDCMQRSKGITRWLAVIDLDEFIVPLKAPTIQALLKEYDTKEIGGLMIFWQTFGTSNCQKLDPKKPLIEQLTLKAPCDHPWNVQVKSICKPHTLEYFRIHGAHYKSGYFDVSSRYQSGIQPPVIDQIQLNHYWTRDQDYFYNYKVPRRARYEGGAFSLQAMEALIKEFNLVKDTAIHRFLPALKRKL